MFLLLEEQHMLITLAASAVELHCQLTCARPAPRAMPPTVATSVADKVYLLVIAHAEVRRCAVQVQRCIELALVHVGHCTSNLGLRSP